MWPPQLRIALPSFPQTWTEKHVESGVFFDWRVGDYAAHDIFTNLDDVESREYQNVGKVIEIEKDGMVVEFSKGSPLTKKYTYGHFKKVAAPRPVVVQKDKTVNAVMKSYGLTEGSLKPWGIRLEKADETDGSDTRKGLSDVSSELISDIGDTSDEDAGDAVQTDSKASGKAPPKAAREVDPPYAQSGSESDAMEVAADLAPPPPSKPSKAKAPAAGKAKEAEREAVVKTKAAGKAPMKPARAAPAIRAESGSESEDGPYDDMGMPRARSPPPPKLKPTASSSPEDVPSEPEWDDSEPEYEDVRPTKGKRAQLPAQPKRTLRHSSIAVGKVIEIKLRQGGLERGTVLKVSLGKRQGDPTMIKYTEDVSGERKYVNEDSVAVAGQYYQNIPVALRTRALPDFVSSRGNLLFSENLTCSKKYGAEYSGTPISTIRSSETGFAGYGKMGDVTTSETSIIFSAAPVHDIADGSLRVSTELPPSPLLSLPSRSLPLPPLSLPPSPSPLAPRIP